MCNGKTVKSSTSCQSASLYGGMGKALENWVSGSSRATALILFTCFYIFSIFFTFQLCVFFFVLSIFSYDFIREFGWMFISHISHNRTHLLRYWIRFAKLILLYFSIFIEFILPTNYVWIQRINLIDVRYLNYAVSLLRDRWFFVCFLCVMSNDAYFPIIV